MTDLATPNNVSSKDTYAYDTFTTGLILGDLAFRSSDPGPGDRMPAFDIELLDGGRLTRDTMGDRPTLIIFGSMTCPVTESSGPVLNDLHRRYGDRVRFVLVNTREAHPGEHLSQPKDMDAKRRRAEELRSHHGFRFEVAVDGIEGAFHRILSPKPNSAYLVRPDGIIAYRAHWANDGAGLERAIAAILEGKRTAGTSRAMLYPLLRAIGHLPSIGRRGGAKVMRDVWRAVPPFAIMALMTRPLGFLPVDMRGPVAATAVITGVAFAAWLFV
jgi:thiol-disulfide isomerase/thioredoxin